MSELTLGLDLGSSSIGWALIDEPNNAIIAAGVRVFPEGVDRDTKGAEVSKNQNRRIARGARRQIARRSRRKMALRKALTACGLLPDIALLPSDNNERVDWEKQQFMRENPYSLRKRALVEKLDQYDLGRALLHLNQRRGFKSNRKADRGRKKENSDMLKEISDLAVELGDQTLGEYLAKIHEQDPHTRIRNRHTRRDMYEKEFEAIWNTQQRHHPDILTNELKQKIHRIIFFQRDMYWPASVIGHCELEPRLIRCPRADNRAQRFRIYQEVNNLRLLDTSTGEERPLTPEERSRLTAYLMEAKERNFDQIRKHLFDQHEGIYFNLEQGGRDKLKGMTSDALLAHKELCGKNWYKRPAPERDWLVAALIDGDESHVRKVAARLELDETLIERLLDVDFEEGYSSYSLHAIKKLLPHLEQGLPLTSRDGSDCALRSAGYILPWEHVPNQMQYLDEPPDVTNPIVRQALHEARKVINAILREYVYRPGHTLARIHIELAREARGTSKQRQQRTLEMRDRQRERDHAAEEIRKAGYKPTGEAIVRYVLWQEQKEICVYSGRPISFSQLFGGEIDIDHILPYSRSLDNSLMNRVVCFRDSNRTKGDRTPHEWLAETDPNQYQGILQRADKLPYPKAKRFRQKSVELDDFFARQFVDTTYITTQVRQYVQCLGADVICVKGQHTSDMRHYWGLDTVLRDDGLHLKNREDHRHHAVDAIAIALTDRSRLQQLASLRRFHRTDNGADFLPEPWPNFRSSVETVINKINVSHRVRRKLTGALHKDTIFGRTSNPKEYVRRKPIRELTNTKQIDKVRDETIKQILRDHLRKNGVNPDQPGEIQKSVWKTMPTMRSNIPIHRVRMIEYADNAIEIHRGGYVTTERNHHIVIHHKLDSKGQQIRDKSGRIICDGAIVTMYEASQRVLRGERIIQRPAGFIMSLSINEMVMLDTGNGNPGLYRVQKISSGGIILRPHTYAGKVSDYDKPPIIQRRSPSTLEGRKVSVDTIGRIRWAND